MLYGVLPFERSYWVIPGQLLAGCVPVAREAEETRQRLDGLVAVGIRACVSLMEAGETNFDGIAIPGYDTPGIDIYRMGFRDMTAPSEALMLHILDRIDTCLAQQRPVYVHCWGGRGRTGTVIGCYLVRHGMTGDGALRMVPYLRRTDPLAHEPSPETAEQIAMVRNWVPGH